MNLPRDTSTASRARITGLLREMTPEDRLAAAADASAAILALAGAGIRARHPEFSEPQVGAELTRIFARDAPQPPRKSNAAQPRR